MTLYSKYADTPNQIKSEGQEITVRFKRNGDGTGTVTWNIPPPSAGCANGVGVYDGIVITVDSKPANYISTSPKNGTYYNSDNSVDTNLHSGDKIDTALVIGAFYHDRTTTSLIITDVKDRVPYYISAYAVDNVGRYHREGVHSYSLPTGQEEGGTPDTVAEHTIQLDPRGGVTAFDITGLDPSRNHGFIVEINRKQYPVTLRGVDVGTYEDLVAAINLYFSRVETPFEAHYPPNTDGLYLDALNKTLKLWDGDSYQTLNAVFTDIDLRTDLLGAYWFNPDDGKLYTIQSGLVAQETFFLQSKNDPSVVTCGSVWFDGTNAYRFNGTTFCQIDYVSSNRNPLLARVLTCENYWFNQANSTLNKWDQKFRRWVSKPFTYSNADPTALPNGYYWFNPETQQLRSRAFNSWFVEEFEVSQVSGFDDISPTEGMVVFSSLLNRWYLYTGGEYTQITNSVIVLDRDPSIVSACDIWWNYTNSNSGLFVRDNDNEEWVQVTPSEFFVGGPDPVLPVVFTRDLLWFNPIKNEYKLVTDGSCEAQNVIVMPYSPLEIPNGALWFDGSRLRMWVSGTWIPVPVIITRFDILNPDDGLYWYDNNETLYRFSATGGWVPVSFSDRDLSPNVGDLWLSTIDSVLRAWDGTSWARRQPLVEVEFIQYTNDRERSRLRFYTRDAGCKYGLEVLRTTESLFTNLTNSVIYDMPIRGNSGKVSGPLYKQLGVGDDGSPDERREIHNHIRSRLGAPSVQVELTKDELDVCIDNALMVLRKYSSYSVKRNMFFLDLAPNQQTYLLTNKCVGFNKITSINAVYRMRGGFFKSSFAGSDLHYYGALQQLYSVATFDMLSFHLVASYMEELETLFATRILYQFYELDRELKIYQTIIKPERILVDAYMEKTEQELFSDKQTAMWIRNWALAEAKLTLSQVRGKFTSLPGPNGSTTLNAQELITQGETEKQELMAALEDMSMQDLNNVGLGAHLIIG